jgi:hypothetical protein
MLYLFISSPHSVTPFHVDRYTTLLLQLQGQKDVMIWDRFDRDTVSEVELESLFGRPHVQNPVYKRERAREPAAFRLEQGDGVHIPFTSPHWVKNGAEVSVSVSFIFQTESSRREADAYRFNYLARRMFARLPSRLPKPPLGSVGALQATDGAKASLLRSVSQLRRGLAR